MLTRNKTLTDIPCPYCGKELWRENEPKKPPYVYKCLIIDCENHDKPLTQTRLKYLQELKLMENEDIEE